MSTRVEEAEIRRALALMLETGSVAELRIPKAGRAGVVSGYFDQPGPLAAAAAKWSGHAEGVYVTLNPCAPALLARAANRTVEHAQATTADANVLRRRWLLIDLDPCRPAGISSTEDEHATALGRARDARARLAERGWPAPVLADSGNGAHLLFRIDLPNDADSTALVRGVLVSLALMFDDENVTVDTSVFNAARISKVYGTLAAKGDSTPERPHRLARVLDAPAEPLVVSPELLAALAALVPIPPPAAASPGRVVDVGAALSGAGHDVVKRKAWNGGTVYELRVCPFNREHARTAYVVAWPDGRRTAGCFHASCSSRPWAEWRAALGLGPAQSNGEPPRPSLTPAPRAAIWTQARTAAELLQAGATDVEWLAFPLCARGAITEINAPRGTGKSVVVLARMVALARTGARVLYLDRDNSPSTLRKRLRGLGAQDVSTLRVLTRDEAPPLTNGEAWAAFPLADFDAIVLDAWDAFAEGAGEQDSRRSTLALAPLLDVVRRDGAPGVIVLCNVTKDGRAGRGSGVLEDRADHVYEARDVTGFAPSGRKSWWEEIPSAARGDWAHRATRRAGRVKPECIRLAFTSSKFRDEDDPPPFALQVNFTSDPWGVGDVTAELIAAGDAAPADELAQAEAARKRAAEALAAEVVRRAAAGAPLLLIKPAEAFLGANGLTRRAARDLLKSGGGGRWRLESQDGRSVAVIACMKPVVNAPATAQSDDSGKPHGQRGYGVADWAARMDSGRPNSKSPEPAKIAAIRGGETRPGCPVTADGADGESEQQEVNPWPES